MKLLSDHDFDIIVFFLLSYLTYVYFIYNYLLIFFFFVPSFSTFVGSLLAGEGILCYSTVFELFAKHGTHLVSQ
jgi:hypothetical protein